MSVDAYWLAVAYKLAAMSTEPRTHVGAVLVAPSCTSSAAGGVVACGCNHRDADDRLHHAEATAVAGIKPEQGKGLTLYAPWAACTDCAAAIIQAGIGTVVVHHAALERTPQRWQLEVEQGLASLLMAGVSVRVHRGAIGGCTALMDGQAWRP